MKALLAALALSTCLSGAGAQAATPEPERAAVLTVVDAFFDAMRAKDGEALRALSQPKAPLAAIAPAKDGGFAIGQSELETFAARVASAPAAFNERYWSPQVLIDGRLAMVWTRYDFHRGDQFTHNGRDLFVLMKTDKGWKIVSLAFTTEPGGVSENPAGPPK